MKKERVVKAAEVMGFVPSGTDNNYISKVLIEPDGVGSNRLMLVEATIRPHTVPLQRGAHPEPYDEAYYILRGKGRVEFGPKGEESYDVEPGMAVFIPARTVHTIVNTGSEDLVFLGIWPVMPEPGIHAICDDRRKAWGTSFRKIDSAK